MSVILSSDLEKLFWKPLVGYYWISRIIRICWKHYQSFYRTSISRWLFLVWCPVCATAPTFLTIIDLMRSCEASCFSPINSDNLSFFSAIIGLFRKILKLKARYGPLLCKTFTRNITMVYAIGFEWFMISLEQNSLSNSIFRLQKSAQRTSTVVAKINMISSRVV